MSLRLGLALALLPVLSSTAFAHHCPTPRNQCPTAISFQAASCFNVDLSAYPLITFYGPDTLDVDPFGPTVVDWSITALATATGFEFVSGTFDYHVGTKDLVGEYTGFTLDPLTGAYTLDWHFTGGTGRFTHVTGFGQTRGLADLSTYCAEYAFTGMLFGYPGH